MPPQIRSIHRRTDMELVGVWVHTPAKVGVDAEIVTHEWAEYLKLSTDGLPGTSVLGDLGVTR